MRLPMPSPDVIYKAVDNGAVLLSVSDEVYYGLNGVGSYIWEHLPPVLENFEALCASVGEKYPDASAETIRADVRTLLEDLMRHGLVRTPAGSDEVGQLEPARLG
ncbi:MAG TPA: PqqD family protein [Gemmatimonadales bacterium]|nr:PqqD family protein [Gemmatimonadales bacterium]